MADEQAILAAHIEALKKIASNADGNAASQAKCKTAAESMAASLRKLAEDVVWAPAYKIIAQELATKAGVDLGTLLRQHMPAIVPTRDALGSLIDLGQHLATCFDDSSKRFLEHGVAWNSEIVLWQEMLGRQPKESLS